MERTVTSSNVAPIIRSLPQFGKRRISAILQKANAKVKHYDRRILSATVDAKHRRVAVSARSAFVELAKACIIELASPRN